MATPTTLPASFAAGNILEADQLNNLRGAFRVLQVVTATYDTPVSSSANTFSDTGLTATITPQSSSSKILVIVNQNGVSKSAGNAGNGVSIALLRGASIITYPATGAAYTATAIQNFVTVSATYLDSPNTTSATTYKTQFGNVISAAAVGVQSSVGVGAPASYICLMEISA
jgi:hypothetical protein